MFAPGEIVYGHVKHIGKHKYAVCMYRNEEVNILIHFTTSQPRARGAYGSGTPWSDIQRW